MDLRNHLGLEEENHPSKRILPLGYCPLCPLQSPQHLYSTAAAKAVGIQGTPRVKAPTICWENISY